MLRACGITAFLTPLPPLTLSSTPCSDGARLSAEATDLVTTPVGCAAGDLKNVPEDFVVVEVDPTGQRTDAEDYNFLSVSPSSPRSCGADDPVDRGAKENTFSREEAALRLLPPVLSPQVKQPGTGSRSMQALRDMLTERTPELQRYFGTVAEMETRVSSAFTQTTLSLLLRDIRAAAQGSSTVQHDAGSTTSCAVAASLPWWRTPALTLGHFAEKRERQLVHLMVRWRFPHLRSCADAPSPPCATDALLSGGNNASVISCSVDLHYVLFCATLGNDAGLCIARWSVEAQTARQAGSLSDEIRAELREFFSKDDSEAWSPSRARMSAAAKGVCCTSFDSLAEAMRRQPPHEAVMSAAAESIPLVSNKDVRRQVHELLRRFYPFVSCYVREGRVTLRYRTPPDDSSSSSGRDKKLTNSSTARPVSSTGPGGGARRTRAEMEDNSEDALSLLAAPVLLSATPAYVHIVVRKRNLDTAEMRQLLAEYFAVKDGFVCVAGMKDKKAVSVQRCSVPVVTTGEAQRRIRALLTSTAAFQPVTLRWPADPQQSYAVLLRASASSAPVHLGQLSGNWFSLRVRNVRWAGEADLKRWAAPPQTTTLEHTPPPPFENAQQRRELRAALQHRFARCAEVGFINYFGQQRFSETIERVDDHTGVHLFAGRWVVAVRSLYRACLDVYNAFPDKMEARFVSGNSRDAQVMTHALRQAYRMYFSEYPLSSADVQKESDVWTRLCEKAITEGVPFYLRALWVHAGQSVFFNLVASYVVSRGMASAAAASRQNDCGDHQAATSAACTNPGSSPSERAFAPLSLDVLASVQLPLGGYYVDRVVADSTHLSDSSSAVLWTQWKDAAIQHTLQELRWTLAQAFEQRRVAGVPVPGSWRALVARPTDASLDWEAEASAEAQQGVCLDCGAGEVYHSVMRLSFVLPSSCYATVFLREVLGCDKWW
ncbi:pseudouridine synthase, putative [Leishmania panamensis]|uniref:Pseudouridine synthase, putative n=1 Tax=Leishmania panamensis TaxID=5679 RepID=A0A088S130_LEIPA|nr:pseudouridine synthase, putative [Leishmania panamensis]AIO01240.1 pseudouridine synthase, putative [Leishmania panamensis]